MDEFALIICLLSFFVLVYGLISNYVANSLYIPEPLVSLIFGAIIGPCCLNLLNIGYIDSKIVMYHFSRAVLCIQIMTAAMSLPRGYVLKKAKSLCIIVILISILEWLITSVIVYIFSYYNLGVSLAISACLTPTDPVLSNSIVKSKFSQENVAPRLKNLIIGESGINDGFGLIILYISLGFIIRNQNTISKICILILKGTILSAISGILIGYVSRKALKLCYTYHLVGTENFLIYGIALTFFSVGMMDLVGGSEMVCVFFTGTAFSWDEWFILETRESRLQEVIDSLFSSTFFVFFGSRIDFSRFSFNILIGSLVILLSRRPPVFYIFRRFIPEIRNRKEALFIGWFGPIGIGALFYSLTLDKLIGTVTIDYVSIVVLCSAILHGLTVPLIKYTITKIEYDSTENLINRMIF
ncbi:Na(+)/H(+) antiporter [Hamiltosporidium magnivora]|uniref:Na(+)/H(+) antiporter n=1 Tax=Hamiltosporidium magnivora TaxID=148818 RepID=A0A4Q9LQI0_9MICR|nr:Na(+)/H(+) antiporter [Hamiltosporidium magnivora]